MENASKALIIAGAILISIILVSVGVLVVQSLNPNEAISGMDQNAKDAFNAKFIAAAGNNVAGSTVRTLIRNVITSNTDPENQGEEARTILVTLDGNPINKVDDETATALSQAANSIITSHRYNVLVDVNSAGLVHTITITDNNKK